MLRLTDGPRLPLKKWAFPLRVASRQEFDRFVDMGAIRNYEPEVPFLTRSSRIVTIGSCFAQNIAKCLQARQYDVHRFDIQERLFTPFALAEFCEKLADKTADLSEFQEHWDLDEGSISATRAVLASGAFVIVTLGLSIAWFDNETNTMIFDPARKTDSTLAYDRSGRYEMRQTTVAENVDAIWRVINALRAFHPSTQVALTLSPIPLRAVANDNPTLVADAISKSTLRVALDEIMQTRIGGIYYFPSFEILKWFAPMVAQIWFEDDMLIHVRNDWIEYTMSKFMQFYCGEAPISPPIPDLPEKVDGPVLS